MQTLDYNDLVRMIRAAAAKIRANEQELSRLDSAIGDGDHGTTICKVMDAAEAASQADHGGKIADLLNQVGWDVMCVDGGSTPPLLGSFFTGMAEGAGDAAQLDTTALAALFEAGLAGMRAHTKAEPGDKTLMDAMVPAIKALRAAADAGMTPPEALSQAADAATRGAIATKDMLARFGRARNLGDRTRGVQDPGATSVAMIFQAFADAALLK